MIIGVLIVAAFLLFLVVAGYAVRDVFLQTKKFDVEPGAGPAAGDVAVPMPTLPATTSGWTALDDLQLARLLEAARMYHPNRSHEKRPPQ